jgi:hypothetical protein
MRDEDEELAKEMGDEVSNLKALEDRKSSKITQS